MVPENDVRRSYLEDDLVRGWSHNLTENTDQALTFDQSELDQHSLDKLPTRTPEEVAVFCLFPEAAVLQLLKIEKFVED